LENLSFADIQDEGAIQQIWMTPTGNWRFSILRIYWDAQSEIFLAWGGGSLLS
jgi:hypothetical protein